jgi:hypothetical protein
MSGKIIGSIVGAAAAYFTGGIALVGFGAAIGGALGSLLDPKEIIEGPRLEDLKVQVSTYGIGIPRLYGTERFGGNVIWSTDKLEIATDTEAGKGGGPINRNYKYYVHMSLLLCETPRDGSTVSIMKFFQDGKLIWDASSGIPIASALASAENPYSAFVLFQGHNDQLPDPIEESWTGGPGTCSAYRGIVRIRMIAIECPGGRVPQFSFVLTNSVSVTPTLTYGTQSAFPAFLFASYSRVPVADPLTVFLEMDVGTGPARHKRIDVWALGQDYSTQLRSIETDNAHNYAALVGVCDIDLLCFRYVPASTGVDEGVNRVFLADGTNKVFAPGFKAYGQTSSRCAKWKNHFVITGDVNQGTTDAALFEWDTGDLVATSPSLGATEVWITDSYIWTQTGTVSSLYSTVDFSFIGSTAMPAGMSGDSLYFSPTEGDQLMAFSNSAAGINTCDLWRLTVSAATITFTIIYSSPTFRIPAMNSKTIGYSSGVLVCVADGSPTTQRKLFVIRFNPLTLIPRKVKDVILGECLLAGDGVYDVTGIPDSDTVIGYKIANPASARANIEPLLTLIGGYVVDEDGATKFKKFADITSVASVSFDELGQAEGDASGEAMPLNRTQEIDLPRSVTTTYIEPTNDYQTAAETEVRQVTDATEDVQISLPICVTSDQAKKVSQMSLYDRWRRQNTRTTSVSRKFAAVSPGDGVTIEYPRGTWKLWLVLSTNDTGAVCEWSLCPGDASIFTQTAIGATGYTSQLVDALAPPTKMQILDMPIVRDEDNNASLYVAFDSYATGPADAELFVGDDDTTLTSRGTVSTSAPLGFAETVMGAWAVNVVDESNLVTVNLGDDVFNSCTRDVLLAGGGEYWAYGAPGRWEIGASAQGDSLGSGRYTLSRHLRGLFGTERFTGTHVAGDVFVLLRIAGMLRPNLSVGEIGQAKLYRAVTKNRSFDSVPSTTYSNTGEGLKPLSPVNLRRTDANDLIVDRRSRLAMNNSTGALPLGETAEAWFWEFYNDSTYTTLLGSTTTNTSAVTAAQQLLAGVSPSNRAYVRVRQLSDSAGPGHELQAFANGGYDPLKHRYWRLTMPTLPSGGSLAVAEILFRGEAGGPLLTGLGTPFASSWYLGPVNPSFGPANAFNNDGPTGSYYLSQTAPITLGYDFGVGNSVQVKQYGLMSTLNYPTQMPATWTLEFSDDGVNYTTADTRSGITWSASQTQNFLVP